MVPGFTKILGESETIGWYEFASDCISALVPTAQSPLYFPPFTQGGLDGTDSHWCMQLGILFRAGVWLPLGPLMHRGLLCYVNSRLPSKAKTLMPAALARFLRRRISARILSRFSMHWTFRPTQSE